MISIHQNRWIGAHVACERSAAQMVNVLEIDLNDSLALIWLLNRFELAFCLLGTYAWTLFGLQRTIYSNTRW